MKKNYLLLLAIILIGAFLVRLYHFNKPVADWHSWRQVDTSSVSRNFVTGGFDILHPRFDDLSMGVSLLDNPNGYRFVEFPFYNIAQAGLYKVFGVFTLEEWGRLVTIFSQLVSIVFLYLLVSKYTSKMAGLISAAFFAFIPFNIYYGRTILPDSSMVAALLAGVYFFSYWCDTNKSKYLILSLIFIAASFLLKPYALFFMLPVAYLAFNKFGKTILKKKELWLFAIFSLIPFILWRWWMGHYPQGIPQSNWLFNGTKIRFKGAFFQWIFADRLGSLILGYYGLPFVTLGIILKLKKEGLLYVSFLVSSLVYIFVLATGNVQHDYYQILVIPALSMFFGKGMEFILTASKEVVNRIVVYIVCVASVLLMLSLSWFLVRSYYDIEHNEVYQVGIIADKILPKDAKVVAPFGGDTTFLYYVNRKGWPVVDRPFKDLVKAGASYMVFANPTKDEEHLDTLYTVFAKGTTGEGDSYVIFNLTKPLTPGKY